MHKETKTHVLRNRNLDGRGIEVAVPQAAIYTLGDREIEMIQQFCEVLVFNGANQIEMPVEDNFVTWLSEDFEPETPQEAEDNVVAVRAGETVLVVTPTTYWFKAWLVASSMEVTSGAQFVKDLGGGVGFQVVDPSTSFRVSLNDAYEAIGRIQNMAVNPRSDSEKQVERASTLEMLTSLQDIVAVASQPFEPSRLLMGSRMRVIAQFARQVQAQLRAASVASNPTGDAK